MLRWLLGIGMCLVCGTLLLAVPLPGGALTYVDLQAKANQKLKDNLHSGIEGNNLASLTQGEQKLEGVKFKIGEGLIQLGSTAVPKMPEKVEGIKIDKKFAQLHILHGTGYGGGPNTPGSQWHVPDDTLIGKYLVHYEDKTEAAIEIVYGKDVRDWWFLENEEGVSRGKVAWTGENDHAKKAGAKLRLYLTTWKNPKPDKKVVSMDYVSTKTTAAAPFCVAMTLEAK